MRFPFSTFPRRIALWAVVAFLIPAMLPTALPATEIPPHAVALMYHRFGETAHPATNIRLDQFEAHLAHLEQGGYRVWPLERIVAALDGAEPLPDRVVAVTVDDAYRSVYTEAWPRMAKRNWPFTVFVSTGGVDRNYRAYMGWKEIKEMAAGGLVTFANHGTSHDHLLQRLPGEDDGAWRKRITLDITGAQQRLTEELGHVPALFAYPYGEYDATLLEIVAGLGFTAFGQHSGAIGSGSHRAALPRFPMSEQYGKAEDFKVKVASLPLPVTSVHPTDPVTRDPRPELTVTLSPNGVDPARLACYATGQGAITVTWQGKTRFIARAGSPLPAGRSRYNCTAPSAFSGRYHWFSHPWLRP